MPTLTDPIIQVTLGVAASLTYTIAVFRVLDLQRRRRKERRDELLSTVSLGLANGTIADFADLVNVYRGVMKLGADDLSYRAGLSSFLRELLVQVVAGKVKPGITPQDLISTKGRITAFLKQSEEASPFGELPDVERNLITDILGFLSANDHPAVARKLDELASAIQVRAQEQVRVERLNRWSVPLAVIGVLLTALFGLLSLRII